MNQPREPAEELGWKKKAALMELEKGFLGAFLKVAYRMIGDPEATGQGVFGVVGD